METRNSSQEWMEFLKCTEVGGLYHVLVSHQYAELWEYIDLSYSAFRVRWEQNSLYLGSRPQETATYRKMISHRSDFGKHAEKLQAPQIAQGSESAAQGLHDECASDRDPLSRTVALW